MKSGQGFLLVFSITSLASLNELYELREQIVRIKEDERVPLVIVGNKSDLEDDRAVSRARAFAVSEGWGHAPYYETSARRRANVDEAFVDLCRQIIRKDMAAHNSARHSASSGLARDSDGIRNPKNSAASNIARRNKKRNHQCNIL
jgi:Ras-related protein Rap-1B